MLMYRTEIKIEISELPKNAINYQI